MSIDPAGRTQPNQLRRHRVVEKRRWVPRFSAAVWTLIAVIAACAVAIVVLSLLMHDDSPKKTAAGVPVVPHSSTLVTPTQAPATTPSADLPEGAVAGGPDGHTYRVGPGLDMPAGKYTTAGALDPGTAGRWVRSRLRSAPNGIPANESAPPTASIVASGSTNGPTTIVLRDGDTFDTYDYKPWHRVP